MTISRSQLDAYLENPCAYFDYSVTRMLTIPDAEREELYLSGIRRRFEQFHQTIPMLERLASNEGVSEIRDIGDVVPLLFDHATYKSYPVSLLDNYRFPQLTAWLNKLTTHDLSKVDVSKCRSIDEWMQTLKRETPMAVGHTSGTSGTMSFLPFSRAELYRGFYQWLILYFQRFGQQGPGVKPVTPLNIHCIYPFFRDGGSVSCRGNDAVVELITGSEGRFHAAYPGYQSADLTRLSALHRAAVARGTVEHLKVSADLLARRDEFIALQRDIPNHTSRFLADQCAKLKGQRVFFWGATNMIYAMSAEGLKNGLHHMFTPESVVMSGGGGKGVVLPPGWQDTIKEFLGVDNINTVYGMSETAGSPMVQCERGHYHAGPALVPFILDPVTNAMLPRKGRVTGRFASYDLIADSHWGGFITGDEVTMECDEPCGCGRTGPYLLASIARFTDKPGAVGEEKINCAATQETYEEALDFLTSDTR
jgi:hypothetical protein